MKPNALRRCKVALAACSRAPDPGLALHYAAAARLALEEAAIEIRQLELLLVERERALVGGAPKGQLEIGGSK